MDIKQFIGISQLSAIRSASRGEEGEYFRDKIKALTIQIDTMPKTYETDGQGDEAPATLHYFRGGSDWYIVEKDMEDEQLQAFGFACLNGDYQNAELGYISIQELIQFGVELDLYYKPQTIGEIKRKFQHAA